MLHRSCVISAVLALSAATGCGPVYTDVEFEPLSEAGSASVEAAGSGGAGLAGSAAGGGGSAGQGAAGMPSGAGSTMMGGSGGSGSGSGGSDSAGAGTGGAQTNSCAALVDWQLAPYQLGQRVLSTCLLPYNGACPVNETHEFECQPPTGAVGLGWCTDRQPGVVNGWDEAWVMHGVCPAAR